MYMFLNVVLASNGTGCSMNMSDAISIFVVLDAFCPFSEKSRVKRKSTVRRSWLLKAFIAVRVRVYWRLNLTAQN